MTHIPEICAKNPYQKTGTINWHKSRALSYLLPKTGRVYQKNLVPNCMSDVPETSRGFLIPVGFECQFLQSMCVIGQLFYSNNFWSLTSLGVLICSSVLFWFIWMQYAVCCVFWMFWQKCYEQKQYRNGLKFAKQILSNPKFAEHGGWCTYWF